MGFNGHPSGPPQIQAQNRKVATPVSPEDAETLDLNAGPAAWHHLGQVQFS